jgi:gamma-glutamylcyclotransferase
MWLDQMAKRCPSSPFVGIGRLPRYRWFINERGYANIEAVGDDASQSPSEVWGLVYSLSEEDEAALDVNEGVPYAYEKQTLEVDLWRASDAGKSEGTALLGRHRLWGDARARIDVGGTYGVTKMLVYVDPRRTKDAMPKEEYVYRMNMGIKDALAAGVPETYVRHVLRRYIPEQADSSQASKAEKQAERFVDGL